MRKGARRHAECVICAGMEALEHDSHVGSLALIRGKHGSYGTGCAVHVCTITRYRKYHLLISVLPIKSTYKSTRVG